MIRYAFSVFTVCIIVVNLLMGQEWIQRKKEADEALKQNNYNRALIESRSALIKARETPNILPSDIAGILDVYGKSCFKLERFFEAETTFTLCAKIRQEISGGNDLYTAVTLHNLGMVYGRNGQYEKAEEVYLKALKIKEKVCGKKHTEYKATLQNLASIYRRESKFSAADSIENILLKINSDSIKNNDEQYVLKKINAESILNLAIIEFKKNNLEKAGDILNEALRLINESDKVKISLLAYVYDDLAILNDKSGNYRAADSLYSLCLATAEKYLGIRHIDYTKFLNDQAEFYFRNNEMDSAEFCFKKLISLIMSKINNYFPFINEKGKFYLWKNLKKYIDNFNFFAVIRMNQNPDILCDVYNNQLATKALIMNASNKIRERILLSNDEELKTLYTEWNNYRQTYSNYYASLGNNKDFENPDLSGIKEKLDKLEQEISQRSLEFAKEYEKVKYTWDEIQRILKDDEAAIEIIRFPSQDLSIIYYAALILTPNTSDHPDIVLMNNGEFLEGVYYNNYKNSLENFEADSESFEQYWGKIHNKINNFNRIYVSADGIYNQVNLNTIRLPYGKFLIDDKELILLTNTKDILESDYSKSKITNITKKDAILFGFPNYNLNKDLLFNTAKKYHKIDTLNISWTNIIPYDYPLLDELPATQKEVNFIDTLLKSDGWNVESYIGDNALEDALKVINSPRVLHIATHGEFLIKDSQKKLSDEDQENAMSNSLFKSVLMFSGANNTISGQINYQIDDGILNAYEAMGLNLDKTELVVLSGCKTASGNEVNGEGVYGMQRAFQVAGARNIIMSLWKVNDRVTQELMVEFYKNWISSKMIHDAFRKAQISVKSKYTQPSLWGAFILVGL